MGLSRLLAAAVAALPLLCGCATVAITGAAEGISYTLSNTAYRTFTAPMDRTRVAAIKAIRRMKIQCPKETCEERTPKGYIFHAYTDELDIDVELEAVTEAATKISVDAKKKVVIKDRAVAVEIINQTAQALGLRN